MSFCCPLPSSISNGEYYILLNLSFLNFANLLFTSNLLNRPDKEIRSPTIVFFSQKRTIQGQQKLQQMKRKFKQRWKTSLITLLDARDKVHQTLIKLYLVQIPSIRIHFCKVSHFVIQEEEPYNQVNILTCR